MRDSYDFSNAIKNPFAGKKEKGKFNVLITYDLTADEEDVHYDDMSGDEPPHRRIKETAV